MSGGMMVMIINLALLLMMSTELVDNDENKLMFMNVIMITYLLYFITFRLEIYVFVENVLNVKEA